MKEILSLTQKYGLELFIQEVDPDGKPKE